MTRSYPIWMPSSYCFLSCSAAVLQWHCQSYKKLCLHGVLCVYSIGAVHSGEEGWHSGQLLLPLIKCPQGRWWQEWQRVVQLIKLKLIIYENNHCSEAIRDYRRKHTFFRDIFVVFITFRINYFDL